MPGAACGTGLRGESITSAGVRSYRLYFRWTWQAGGLRPGGGGREGRRVDGNPHYQPYRLAAIACRGEPVTVHSSLKEIADAAAADAEQQAIRRILQVTDGKKSEAARLLRTDYDPAPQDEAVRHRRGAVPRNSERRDETVGDGPVDSPVACPLSRPNASLFL